MGGWGRTGDNYTWNALSDDLNFQIGEIIRRLEMCLAAQAISPLRNGKQWKSSVCSRGCLLGSGNVVGVASFGSESDWATGTRRLDSGQCV
jgi:hypothetical protein